MRQQEIIQAIVKYCVLNAETLKGQLKKVDCYMVGGRRKGEMNYTHFKFMRGRVIDIIAYLIDQEEFFNSWYGNELDGAAQIKSLEEGREYEITAKYLAGVLNPVEVSVPTMQGLHKIETQERFALYADALGFENAEEVAEKLFSIIK
jgi:hypothetical protein